VTGPGGADVDVPEPRLPSRDEVIAEAGSCWAETCDRLAAMSPREQARAAYKAGGPSVEALEDVIRAQRGLPALDREQGAA
jgi:hypothetical protein